MPPQKGRRGKSCGGKYGNAWKRSMPALITGIKLLKKFGRNYLFFFL
jgi:hypothetical protein